MPATQRKCIHRGLTLDVDRHYIESVTATTHQEKGIITLESNPSRGTVLPAPHGKGNKCDKNNFSSLSFYLNAFFTQGHIARNFNKPDGMAVIGFLIPVSFRVDHWSSSAH